MIFNRLCLSLVNLIEKGSRRYHISALHMTEKFVEMTNGHFLVRVSNPKLSKDDLPISKLHKPMKGRRLDVLVDQEAIEALLKSMPRNSTMPVLTNAWVGRNTNGDQVEFITTDLTTWRPIVTRVNDAKFPKVAEILRNVRFNRGSKHDVSFSVEYMKKMCAFLESNDIKSVKFCSNGPEKPIWMRAESVETEQEIIMVLMPVKSESARKQKPKPEPKPGSPRSPEVAAMGCATCGLSTPEGQCAEATEDGIEPDAEGKCPKWKAA